MYLMHIVKKKKSTTIVQMGKIFIIFFHILLARPKSFALFSLLLLFLWASFFPYCIRFSSEIYCGISWKADGVILHRDLLLISINKNATLAWSFKLSCNLYKYIYFFYTYIYQVREVISLFFLFDIFLFCFSSKRYFSTTPLN